MSFSTERLHPALHRASRETPSRASSFLTSCPWHPYLYTAPDGGRHGTLRLRSLTQDKGKPTKHQARSVLEEVGCNKCSPNHLSLFLSLLSPGMRSMESKQNRRVPILYTARDKRLATADCCEPYFTDKALTQNQNTSADSNNTNSN